MTMQKQNSYDETKKMLNTLRNFKPTEYGTIKEQTAGAPLLNKPHSPEQQSPGAPRQQVPANNPNTNENKDFNVINNVEVIIHSTDQQDLEIKEEEKGQIAQLIDAFRSEVSELAEFGKLNIYEDSATLDGSIPNLNLSFTLSAGDDNGSFLSNVSMLKITDEVVDFITKLRIFEQKFVAAMNNMITARKQN